MDAKRYYVTSATQWVPLATDGIISRIVMYFFSICTLRFSLNAKQISCDPEHDLKIFVLWSVCSLCLYWLVTEEKFFFLMTVAFDVF